MMLKSLFSWWILRRRGSVFIDVIHMVLLVIGNGAGTAQGGAVLIFKLICGTDT
jgi:hypothetical protein